MGAAYGGPRRGPKGLQANARNRLIPASFAVRRPPSAIHFAQALAFVPPHRQNSRLIFGAPKSVANIKSAEKRARQSVKRRAHNMAARSRLRTAIKNVVNAVSGGNKEEAAANLKAAAPVIDSMVTKGIIHRNKAARHKSHLNAQVKGMGAE
jgi:small subunit ribosomal protein S20